MARSGTVLLTLSVLVFIASSLAYALWPHAGLLPPEPPNPWSGLRPVSAPIDPVQLFLKPESLAMSALLGMIWAALAYHVLRIWIERHRLAHGRNQAATTAETRKHDPAPQDPVSEQLPLLVGLLTGATWPWLISAAPVATLLLALLMSLGFLLAALRGWRLGQVIKRSSTLGFVAGWALLLGLSVFAVFVRDRLQVSSAAATTVAVLVGAVAAVSVQLRLGQRIGFSVALIWGLIGIAAGTVGDDAAVATATVVAIAMVAVAVVRVTT